MAAQEERLNAGPDRMSGKITACRTRQFSAFRKTVAVLGLITWKVSCMSHDKTFLNRVLRAAAGLVCMAVSGIGIIVMFLYHTRLRRLQGSRDRIVDDVITGNEPPAADGSSGGEYSPQENEESAVREPAPAEYSAVL